MIKRTLDLFISIILIIIFAIPIFFIIFLIKSTSKGPIIFWSDRVGQFNSIFRMPKFRTMKVTTPLLSTELLINSSDYITKVGIYLRRYSLDELPQLFSVLVGDMSIVGPRPALFNQTNLICLRTKVGVDNLKPGLVGWAQLNGRDKLNDIQKCNLDKEYLDRQCLWFDLKIIFHSIIVVIRGENVLH